MKRYRQLTLVAISLIFLNCACEYEEPPYSLPPITQSGKNTVGCEINGTVWISQGPGTWLTPNSWASGHIDRGMSIHCSSLVEEGTEDFSIYIDGKIEIRKYYLDIDTVQIKLDFKDYSCQYSFGYLNSPKSPKGWIEITKFDTINEFASGLFEFEIAKQSGDDCDSILNITNGRFDLEFFP